MKTDFKRKFLGGVKAGKKNCRASSENFGQNRNQYHPNELNQNDGKNHLEIFVRHFASSSSSSTSSSSGSSSSISGAFKASASSSSGDSGSPPFFPGRSPNHLGNLALDLLPQSSCFSFQSFSSTSEYKTV